MQVSLVFFRWVETTNQTIYIPVPWISMDGMGDMDRTFDCFVFGLVGFTPKELARGGFGRRCPTNSWGSWKQQKHEPCFPGSWGICEIFTPHHLVVGRLDHWWGQMVWKKLGCDVVKSILWLPWGMMILYLCTYLMRICVRIEFDFQCRYGLKVQSSTYFLLNLLQG